MVSLGLHQLGVAHGYGSAFFLGSILVLASNTMAEVRNVPGEYATIQECIDAAEDGDQCVVASGTYNEVINFVGKAITLRSSDGAEVTTIDGTGLNDTVVKCASGETANTVFEGFTVTGGTGFVSGNFTLGGGMYIGSGGPTVTGCVFASNSADGGGGMYNSTRVTTSVSNCTFTGNTATLRGGGMYNNTFSSPTVSDCSFTENRAVEDGGGMRNYESDPTVRDCIFARNSAVSGGGMANLDGSATIESCTFRNNFSEYSGGGMASVGSKMTVRDCRFTGNECGITLGEVDFGAGGGLFYAGRQVSHFTACVFNSNTARVSGGGVANFGGSPFFTRCEISGNRAVYGGAMYNFDNTAPRLTSCTLNGNVAAGISPGGAGGGLYNGYASDPELVNCTVTGNRARIGGGMLTYDGRPRVVNSTFVGNVALENGGGIAIIALGSTFIDNSIVWGNVASGLGPQIYRDHAHFLVISYSVIQGSGGSENWDATVATDGGGNLDADPSLLRMPYDGGDGWSDDPETPDIDEGANDDFGNLRLGIESAAIDAGLVELLPPDDLDLDGDGDQDEPTPFDHDGHARLMNPIVPPRDPCAQIPVDMGAFEFHNDCNGNGVPDDMESNDDDGDGTLNECDVCADVDDFGPDGDSDGVPDPCDVCAGFPDQADADQDGVPDGCESALLYVDASATGNGEGGSWFDAHKDLQTALAVARNRPHQTTEIWVAAGTYKPDVGGCQELRSRESTFTLLNNTSIYGGFLGHARPGGGETDREQRDPVAHPTILSGDLLGDDEPSFVGYDENSFHVVTAKGVDATAVLDGLEISGGSAIDAAEDLGGGILCRSALPTIRNSTVAYNRAGNGGGIGGSGCRAVLENCQIVGNDAANSGGGVSNIYQSMTFLDCVLRANTAVTGGGMYSRDSVTNFTNTLFIENESTSGAGVYNFRGNLRFTNCRFESNMASGDGGAMYDRDSYDVTISGTTITNNSARFGGGLYLDNTVSVTMTDTNLVGNAAERGGGAYCSFAEMVISHCTFEANAASFRGGGMMGWACSYSMVDSIFRDNTAVSEGGGLYNSASSVSTILRCRFEGGRAARGGGLYFKGAERVTDCMFLSNTARGLGGAIYGASSAQYEQCQFWYNTSEHDGGAVYFLGSSARYSRCLFAGNSAADRGGAMDLGAFATPVIESCLFVGNLAPTAGGAVDIRTSSASFFNCSFVSNVSDRGGGMYTTNYDETVAPTSVASCIFWGNGGDTGRHQITTLGIAPLIRYSDIQGSGGSSNWLMSIGVDEGGNIDVLPGFMRMSYDGGDGWGDDPETLDLDEGANDDFGDLRPLSHFVGISAGDPAYQPPAGTADLDGHPRVQCGQVDMGAYEFGVGDFDCNHLLNLNDFPGWETCMGGPGGTPFVSECVAFDFNTDGVIDLNDFWAYQRLNIP